MPWRSDTHTRQRQLVIACPVPAGQQQSIAKQHAACLRAAEQGARRKGVCAARGQAAGWRAGAKNRACWAGGERKEKGGERAIPAHNIDIQGTAQETRPTSTTVKTRTGPQYTPTHVPQELAPRFFLFHCHSTCADEDDAAKPLARTQGTREDAPGKPITGKSKMCSHTGNRGWGGGQGAGATFALHGELVLDDRDLLNLAIWPQQRLEACFVGAPTDLTAKYLGRARRARGLRDARPRRPDAARRRVVETRKRAAGELRRGEGFCPSTPGSCQPAQCQHNGHRGRQDRQQGRHTRHTLSAGQRRAGQAGSAGAWWPGPDARCTTCSHARRPSGLFVVTAQQPHTRLRLIHGARQPSERS